MHTLFLNNLLHNFVISIKMKVMKKSITIFTSIVACLLTGFIASFLQNDSITSWYPLLEHSPLTPPTVFFPIVWSILYILMGISIGLILNSKHSKKVVILIIFAIQLTLNFLWSFVFFYMQNPLGGFINILLLDMFVIIYVLKGYSINKASAWLCVPYLIWLALATHLNWYIWQFN